MESVTIKDRLAKVHRTIAEAAEAAQRDKKDITLVCVSKNHPPTKIVEALEAGEYQFGENRVQEWEQKYELLSRETDAIHWHLIGHLQRNKVKDVIGKVDLIHSVDSIKLIREIDRRSRNRGVKTDILLQFNIAEEESKHGFEADEFETALSACAKCEGIRLKGLMTMAPFYDDPEDTVPVFQQAKELFDKMRERFPEADVLSMGMSHDYAQAIRCGATHIRIGTDIFGPREY